MATTGWVDDIERGPGRHGISNTFFLYVRDADGRRHRGLLLGLSDGRTRSETDQMGLEKPAAANPLVLGSAEKLV